MILETWIWALAPRQDDPQRPEIQWQIDRVGGQEPLAVRTGKRFLRDEALFEQLGPRRLRNALDQVRPLARPTTTSRSSRCSPISRLTSTCLAHPGPAAISGRHSAPPSANWSVTTSHTPTASTTPSQRYVGLTATAGGQVMIDPSGLLVKPEPALAQIERDLGAKPPDPRADADVVVESTEPGDRGTGLCPSGSMPA